MNFEQEIVEYDSQSSITTDNDSSDDDFVVEVKLDNSSERQIPTGSKRKQSQVKVAKKKKTDIESKACNVYDIPNVYNSLKHADKLPNLSNELLDAHLNPIDIWKRLISGNA